MVEFKEYFRVEGDICFLKQDFNIWLLIADYLVYIFVWPPVLIVIFNISNILFFLLFLLFFLSFFSLIFTRGWFPALPYSFYKINNKTKDVEVMYKEGVTYKIFCFGEFKHILIENFTGGKSPRVLATLEGGEGMKLVIKVINDERYPKERLEKMCNWCEPIAKWLKVPIKIENY